MAAVQDLGAYQGDAILVGALADNADLQIINDLTDQADSDDAPAVDGNTVLTWPNDDDEAEIVDREHLMIKIELDRDRS